MLEGKVKLESFEKPRELVEFMNLRRLSKEDVLAILDRKDEVFLIYLG